jgi:hypothetical protein
MTAPSNPARQAAEGALMDRLEAWAKGLGVGHIQTADGRRYYPSRTIASMRRAHAEGRLIDAMTDWLPSYRRNSGTPAAARMADIVKAGLVPWEALLLELGKPWTTFVTDAQREVLCRVLRDTYDTAASHYKLRVAAAQSVAARRARTAP